LSHAVRQVWRAAVLAGLGALLLLQFPAIAATSEAQVKAAYVYKLASFVRWPDEAARTDDFRLCISGRRDVAGVLQDLVRGQRVDGRPVAVVELGATGGEAARSCRVLFVGRGGAAATSLLGATDSSPVLTVCDRNKGTRGCIIEFVLRDGKVRFALDRARAERRKLELSAKLVDVAVQ
jgi:hypothetical protein